MSHTWSFSSIKKFQTCPLQFYETKVLKNYKEAPTEATMYGSDFHEAAEKFIGSDEELPVRFNFARAALERLKAYPGTKYCEYEMGLTEGLAPCLIDDQDVWWKGIADLIIVNGEEARVVDYKTGGSARYAERGQLELMALAIFKHFPEVKVVKAALLFVVAKALIKETYSRNVESTLWGKWLAEHRKLEKSYETNVWNPKESGLCRRHCVVETCIHNGRNK